MSLIGCNVFQDFVAHGLGNLQGQMTEAPDTEYRDTFASSGLASAVCAHSRKSSAEKRGRLPVQPIGQQGAALCLVDHVLGITAAISDPGSCLGTKLDLFLLAVHLPQPA